MRKIFTLMFAAMLAVGSISSSLGDLVINEIDADTAGTDVLEFIELFGDPNMSLDGFSIVGVNGSDDLTYDTVLFDLDGFSTDANGFFLIANSGFPGGSDIDMGANNRLQNGADALVLFTGNAVDFPNDSAPPTGASVVDVIHYGTNDSADAGLAALYPTAGYFDEGTLGDKDTDSIARSIDGTGGFQTVDAPTPGVSNVAVPEPSCITLLGLVGLTGVARRRK